MVPEPLRPMLLPQNLKIRHIQGIYLRNLTLTRKHDLSKENTTVIVSPSKSSSSLRHSSSIQSHDSQLPPHGNYSDNFGDQLLSPQRSTKCVGASPNFRSRKLDQDAANNSSISVEVFVTLHCASQSEPIYISEVVKDSVNPTFRLFDLSVFGPTTTRLDSVSVRVWVKKGGEEENFDLFLEKEFLLRSLQFIGKLTNHQFPPNSILFHLFDGIYAMNLASETYTPIKPGLAPLPTSSYSALMRLSNLDQSIQDALVAREELATQVNEILQRKHMGEALQAQEQVILAHRYLIFERKPLKSSIRRRKDLKSSIDARKKAIQAGLQVQAKAIQDMENAQEKLLSCRIMLKNTISELRGQRRRICEELQVIFPIEPIINQPFVFTICGLHLPNANYDDSDEDTISAALGYVAQIVNMLQYYLSIPLPYPISPYGSRAIIHDYISILQDKQRTFPLYLRGTVRFRFEYGVFLLNKNVEWLAKSQGLKILDLRYTLSNLKYLLYICSAGNTELPTRKAGGVRSRFAENGGTGMICRYGSRS